MNHRKLKHKDAIAVCKNNLIGRCPYTPEVCWWKHETHGNMSREGISCYICSQSFPSLLDMMTHKKKNHRGAVRRCQNYLKDNCRFHSNFCWFLHEDERMEAEENIETKDDDKEHNKKGNESVFQKVPENTEPPIPNQSEEKAE